MPDGDYNPVSPQKYCLFLIKKNFSQIISGVLRRQASDKNNRLVCVWSLSVLFACVVVISSLW